MSNTAATWITEKAKKLVFRYTTLGRPDYRYCVEPLELASIVIELDRLKSVRGSFVEIGVARGMTTRFVAEHIRRSGSGDRIFAVDTFASFTPDDIAYEVNRRGKAPADLIGFSYNDFEVWKRNFRDFDFVTAIQSDCSEVGYTRFAPIKVAFLDVDLYLPTRAVLPKLYAALVDDGVILVDDVLDGGSYDGAYQAYMEFCAERSLPPVIVGNRCGVIRKATA